MKKTKGFTLIELLVVVLIIGILAAIAVPQYQKTVWKSRAAQLLLAVKDLRKAQNLYYVANNTYPEKISELDVDWPGWTNTCSSDFSMFEISSQTKNACLTNGDFVLFLRPYSNGNFALFSQGKYKYAGFYINQETDIIYCYEMGAINFCKDVLACTRIPDKGNSGNHYYSCPSL